MEANRITLYVAGGCWNAWHRGPHAERIRDLFGTDVLPTAFLAGAPAATVAARIRALNPGVEVVALRVGLRP